MARRRGVSMDRDPTCCLPATMHGCPIYCMHALALPRSPSLPEPPFPNHKSTTNKLSSFTETRTSRRRAGLPDGRRPHVPYVLSLQLPVAAAGS